MIGASLALSECSPAVNSGRPKCPRRWRHEQRKGKGESELGRLDLGLWPRSRPARARGREKGEREQLGRGHSWAASIAGPGQERESKESFPFLFSKKNSMLNFVNSITK
jgi:hypothetical protein